MERDETFGHSTGHFGPGLNGRTLLIVRHALHMFLGAGQCCRHIPCCSAYAREAVSSRPFGTAICKILLRLLRCHPWSRGGWDPLED